MSPFFNHNIGFFISPVNEYRKPTFTSTMHLEPCNPPLVDPLFLELFLPDQSSASRDSSNPVVTAKPDISISLPGEHVTTLSFSSPLVRQLTCSEILTPSSPSWNTVLTSTTPKSSREQPHNDRVPRQIIVPIKPEVIRPEPRLAIPKEPISPTPTSLSPDHVTTTSTPVRQTTSVKRPHPSSLERTPDGRIILTREVIEESRERLRAKRPRLRHGIGGENISVLESWYQKYSYLSKEGRKVLSEQTGLPVKTVMYWFQNKRRMMKQKMGIDHSTSMARLMKC